MLDVLSPALLPPSQTEKERAEEIERDNFTLLKKMQHIMKTEGGVDHKNTYKHHRCACSRDHHIVESLTRRTVNNNIYNNWFIVEFTCVLACVHVCACRTCTCKVHNVYIYRVHVEKQYNATVSQVFWSVCFYSIAV